jgi:hypothetical protein
MMKGRELSLDARRRAGMGDDFLTQLRDATLAPRSG